MKNQTPIDTPSKIAITRDKRNLCWLKVGKKRVNVQIATGPWNEHALHPQQIKLRPRQRYFPAEVTAALSVTNNSDSRADYFECDSIRLLPGDPLYRMAEAAAAPVSR